MTDTLSKAPSAASIAMDLAAAIHQGLIRPDHQIPSQSELMATYGVAMATAAAAIAKVREAGLIYSVAGRGSFVVQHRHGDVETLYLASLMCAEVAAASWLPGSAPMLAVPTFGSARDDDERPPRMVDVAAMVGLDRSIARALAQAFRAQAHRIVGFGPSPDDAVLVAAAKVILRDGGARPEGQPGIAMYPLCTSLDHGAAMRLWPHLADPPGPDDPPF